VTSIGNMAFAFCSGLTSVAIPDSVTNLGTDVFTFCTSLTNVTLGAGVTSIGSSAFWACTSLPGVTISSGVTNLGYEACWFCTNLTSINIPGNVTNIDLTAFDGCLGLNAITVDSLNPAYSATNEVLFDKSQATLIRTLIGNAGNYTVPGSVTSIGNTAFSGCCNLTGATIPNSVTNLGSAAFYFCSSLTNVTLSTNLTSIGNDTFAFCPSLISLAVPGSVNSIGTDAFSLCASLSGIYFRSNAPSAASTFIGDTNTTAYYLPGTTNWSSTWDSLPTALWLPQAQNYGVGNGGSANQFGFNISWASGETVVVEACTNLVNAVWQPVQTNTLSSDTLEFSDPQSVGASVRFYRLRSP